MNITQLAPEDFHKAMALGRRTEGIGVNDANTLDMFEKYLARNPDMSFALRWLTEAFTHHLQHYAIYGNVIFSCI